MKKVVASFIAGALCMISFQVFADDISLIGKKVAGEKPVSLDGKTVGQAVIIDGKSYLPVRETASAFNADVNYDKGGITLTSPEESPVTPIPDGSEPTEPVENPPVVSDPDPVVDVEKENQKAILQNKIDGQKLIISKTEEEVASLTKQVSELKVKADADKTVTGSARTQYSIFNQVLEETKSRLEKEKQELAKFETQMAELK